MGNVLGIAASDGNQPGTPVITSAFDIGSNQTFNSGTAAITFTGVNTGKFPPSSYTITSSGAQTGTVSTTVSRTNLTPNPSFEGNITGWSAVGTIGTYSTAQAKVGTGSCLIAYNGSATAGIIYNTSNGIPVTGGQVITFSFYALRSADIGQITYNHLFYKADGTTLVSDYTHANIAAAQSTTGWYRTSQTVVVPYGAAYTQPRIYITSAEGAGAVAFNAYIDAVLIEVSSVMKDYFDGTNSILTHTYSGTPTLAWTGTANASTSTMTGVSDYSGPYGGTVSGLTAGSSYTYTVTQTNAITTGLPSTASAAITATTLPSAPATASAAIVNTTTVNITYGAFSAGGSTLVALAGTGTNTGDITDSTGTSVALTYSGTLSAAGGVIAVTGSFTQGNSYTFNIRSSNLNGVSAYTTTAAVTPNPTPPPIIAVTPPIIAVTPPPIIAVAPCPSCRPACTAPFTCSCGSCIG